VVAASKACLLGRITGVFGLRGWLKVFSYTRPKENILAYDRWLINQQWFDVVESQTHGKNIIALLAGIEQRDLAAKLVDADIYVARQQLPTTQADEYYWADLIGLAVVNKAGEVLGQVVSLLETGAHDVLVVQGARQRLIPLVFEHIVQQIDLSAKQIKVDWDSDF
jgi:16S rRNA processing protein RimM